MNFVYPLSRYIKITQIYWSSHLGVDFGWNDGSYCNQPIIAIEDGIVVSCADGFGNTYPSQRIYGNYVCISHGSGWWSMYGHLLKGISVRQGQRVRKGEVIGYMGNSGYSNGQHLHFELRNGENRKEKSIDPIDYLFVEDPSIYVNPSSKQIERIRHRTTTVGTPVGRDPSHDQIEVITRTLNARRTPGLDGEKRGFCTVGVYNVLAHANADGFQWSNIEPDLWIAEREGDWTVSYPRQSVTMFSVLFPEVTNGDKITLCKLGDSLSLKYNVTESRTFVAPSAENH